eukprot:scaffold28228_cov35-Attheya_sp.AAC.1
MKIFADRQSRHSLNMHGDDMPGTHARGSLPIDGIFGTAGLKPTACGFTPFDHGIGGDHRLVWIEFTYVNAFGHRLPALDRPLGRRLKLNDPRVKKSFRLHREKSSNSTIFENKCSWSSRMHHTPRHKKSRPSFKHWIHYLSNLSSTRIKGVEKFVAEPSLPLLSYDKPN